MIVIEGKGRDSDHRAKFLSALMQAVDETEGNLSIVEIVGCLEIAKLMLIDGPDEE